MQRLIYLLRHGKVDTTAPRRFLGRTDLPLNVSGMGQALSLAEQLRAIPFARVVASPLKRAVQTAVLASGRPIEAIEIINELAEIDLGAWEGRTVAEIEQHFPGAYEERGRNLAQYQPLNGESFADLANRVCPALFELAGRDTGPLLIVAHAGVNRVLLSRLLHRPLQRLLEIPQDHGAVNILRRTAQGIEVGAINLVGWLPSPHSFITAAPGDSI